MNALGLEATRIESYEVGAMLFKRAAQFKVQVAPGCFAVVSRKEALYVLEQAFRSRAPFALFGFQFVGTLCLIGVAEGGAS